MRKDVEIISGNWAFKPEKQNAGKTAMATFKMKAEIILSSSTTCLSVLIKGNTRLTSKIQP